MRSALGCIRLSARLAVLAAAHLETLLSVESEFCCHHVASELRLLEPFELDLQ